MQIHYICCQTSKLFQFSPGNFPRPTKQHNRIFKRLRLVKICRWVKKLYYAIFNFSTRTSLTYELRQVDRQTDEVVR
jgi:hypothetical protein